MAGNYPDATSWRMAIDKDGTQVYRLSGDTLSQLSAADLVNLNNETVQTAVSGGDELIVIFPQKRDLDGYFLRSSGGVIGVKTSVDSTNGVDGTWVTGVSTAGGGSTISPDYRAYSSTTKLGIKAVKFTAPGSLTALHLYGENTVGQSLDQLILWSAFGDERVSPSNFDWGNVPRSSTDDRYFRVKNTSTLLTARNVVVAMESPTDSTPSAQLEHIIAKDTLFLAQQTIGAIGPGAISGVLTLRRITPSNAQLGLHTFRLYAEAESWS